MIGGLTLFQILPLLSMAFMLTLGIIVFRNKPTFQGGLFASISLVFAIWTFGSFMMFINTTDRDIIFWDRFIYFGVVFMPALQYHFSLTFTYTNRRREILLITAYILSTIFLFLSRTDLFVADVFRYRWGVHAEAQIFHHFFLAFFFFYIFALLYNFYVQYKHTEIKTEKSRLKLVILSFMILNLVGGLGYLPAYRIPIFSPISLLAPLIFSILTAYAIVRYRLLDVRIVLKKSFIYFGLIVFVYIVLTIWSKFIPTNLGHLRLMFHLYSIITAIVIIVGVFLIKLGLEKMANKYFFLSLYNYQETLSKMTSELNYHTNLDEIINSIVDTIKQTMQLDRAGVLLINQNTKPILYKIARVEGFNEKNGISLVKDNFLTRYLQKTQKPLVRDELMLLSRDSDKKTEKKNFEILHDHMKHIEASLCLPLISSNKLIGIIVLGSKISEDAYTKEDLDLLDTLSKQAGIAVENAKLYDEIKKFNETLQNKVNEQTKDIQKKAMELEDKNKSLEELLNMKSDFLRVVHHQLNTPISIMKNSLFMIKDKTFTKDKGLKFIEAGLKRVDETINDFWSAFALEGSKIKMDPKNVDIKKLTTTLLEEKKHLETTTKRNLKLKLKNPNKKIPLVFCDPRQITQALSNLLDNAIHYTPSGYIEISFEEVGGMLKIRITDTGSGISEEDQEKLFEKFSRGSRATEFYANGSGLGLYIAKKIIEGNEGKLELEETQVNKGTTFTITLPIFTNQIPIIIEKSVKPKSKRKKKTILFIEDEKDFSDIYKNYFNKKGYIFEITDDIKEASEIIEKIKPDLILLDIILPQKKADGSITNIVAEQGWEFLKKAKKETNLLNIPIIIFTNLNSSKDRQKAKRLQARDYVLKNEVTPKKLEEILRNYY